MRRTMASLLLAIIIGVGCSAVPIEEIDLSPIACQESDFPDGWVFESETLEGASPTAINSYGVTFKGPNDFECGCELRAFETEDSAQQVYAEEVEEVKNQPIAWTVVPIKAIGDESLAVMSERNRNGMIGYLVTVRKGPFIFDVGFAGFMPFPLESLDALLKAVVARIPG